MVVLLLEKVPATLRGELSRWMVEPRPGVFVGQVSAMVRDRLWQMAVRGAEKSKAVRGGGAMLLYSSPTEQGFQVRTFGETRRDIADWEGLMLVRIPTTEAAKRPRTRRPNTPASPPEAGDSSPLPPAEPEAASPASEQGDSPIVAE